MSQADAAYLAGLIDGEGTVTLARRHRHENRRISVSICNTEIALVLAAQRMSGLGVISQKRRNSAHHAQAYVWAVWGRQALDVLRQVQPWMRSYKAGRAALALSEYIVLTPRNGKYTAKQRKMRDSFEERLLALLPQPQQSANMKCVRRADRAASCF